MEEALTARYRGVNRARAKVQRVQAALASLVLMIREEEVKPGFCGPDAREIDEIGARAIAEIDDALFRWTAEIAATPRALTVNAKLREALGRR